MSLNGSLKSSIATLNVSFINGQAKMNAKDANVNSKDMIASIAFSSSAFLTISLFFQRSSQFEPFMASAWDTILMCNVGLPWVLNFGVAVVPRQLGNLRFVHNTILSIFFIPGFIDALSYDNGFK